MDDYDFFIAHAGADLELAEALYDSLKRRARCFIDTRDLQPGDNWDTRLPEAQRRSRITIVVLSSHTDRAFYEREEIAAAIRLSRGATTHRVVPVVHALGGATPEPAYGLERVHALYIRQPDDFDTIVSNLFEVLRRTTEQEVVDTPPLSQVAPVVPAPGAEDASSQAVNPPGSFAFLIGVDLVKFSFLDTDEQVEAYATLRASILRALAETNLEISTDLHGPTIWSPGGDGGTLSLRFTDARTAFRLAEALHGRWQAENALRGTDLEAVFTLHAGMVQAGADLNGTPNVWGEAINVVNHLLSVCEPNEIVASAAFASHLCAQSRDYQSRFGRARKRALKHGTLFTVQSVVLPSSENRDLRGESEDMVDIFDFEAPFQDMLTRYDVLLNEAISAQSGIWTILLSRRLRDLGAINEADYRDVLRRVSLLGRAREPRPPHHELFSQFDDDTLHRILASGSFRRLAASSYLCRTGDRADHMYVVAQGSIHVIENDELIAIRRPGDLIGEMALIEPVTQDLLPRELLRTADLQCPEETTVFVIPYDAFGEASRSSPSVRDAFRRLYRTKRKESVLRRAQFFDELSPILTKHDVRRLVDWARLITVRESEPVEVPSDLGALLMCGLGEVELRRTGLDTTVILQSDPTGPGVVVVMPGEQVVIVGVRPSEIVGVWGSAWEAWHTLVDRYRAGSALRERIPIVQ